MQERTIVNEADEEAKKNRKKILGIFPRSKTPISKPGSGTATPKDGEKTSSSTPSKRSGEYSYDDDDDDELPPGEEGDIGDLGHRQAPAAASTESVNEEEEAVRRIPKTAGFDFAAISRELGKDIDVDNLPVPPEARSRPLPPPVKIDDRPPIERTGSAPPMSVQQDDDETLSNGRTRNANNTHVFSPRSFGEEGDDDDIGDIAGSTKKLSLQSSSSNVDLPSWDRPSATAVDSPVSTTTSIGTQHASFGFNAWSPSSTAPAPAPALRSAPPARPHPAEFMANPFAAPAPAPSAEDKVEKKKDGFGFGFGAWGKKGDDPWSQPSGAAEKKRSPGGDDQWAERNPW